MDSLQGVWLWASVAVALLVLGLIKAWLELSKNTQSPSIPTWLAASTLFVGLGYQCSYDISLISSVGMLLLPMSFTLLILTLVLNLKLKTPLLVLMSNPLSLLLMLAGIRLVDKIEAHKELDMFLAMHILFVMTSFLVIFLSVMVASVLLLQDLKLKRKISFKITLPSLDFLERVVRSLNNLALFLLTLGIGASGMYVNSIGKDITSDSTFYWTVITWALLCLINFLHFTNRLSGQRYAWCNFFVLIAAIITLLGQNHG